MRTHGKRSWLRAARIAALAVQAAALIVPFAAGGAANAIESRGPAQTAVAGTLDHRVAVLSKALDLDARQRAALSRLFADQREAVQKIWRDPALLPAERAPATRAVENRTADAIREMLTDEQRKKYNPPKPAQPARQPELAAWMDATRAK